MQTQQAAGVVAQHVQRLQHSISHGNTAGQAQALKELLQLAVVADAAGKVQILQQPGILATLRQLFDKFTAAAATSNSRAFSLAAVLLAALSEPGRPAAELIAAQPGMLPALAGLLARRSTAAARCAPCCILCSKCLCLPLQLQTYSAACSNRASSSIRPGIPADCDRRCSASW